jgi:TRAP-type mannitol/chloroaromatic compound transport system permease small subunit
MRTLLAFLWRYLLGALFTLTPFTAVLVVGWTQRATARSVARRWSKDAGEAIDESRWPRWIMADEAGGLLAEARRSGVIRAPGLIFHALFGSLWLNAKAGVTALIPVALVVMPAALLILFAWWSGWENSFNKGYEQAWVGPIVSFIAIGYFMVAMTLLPLAEVRQALNNSWVAFFDVRFLRRLAREAKLGLIGLAILFATAGFVVAVMKIGALPLGNSAETPADALRVAQIYPLAIAALLFPLYVGLRLAAARLYARAAVRLAAKDGTASFAARERELLDRLSLEPGSRGRGMLARFAAGSSSLAMGALASFVMFAIWFGFVAEIYTAQFLAHDWTHWVNHPLVQLPWVGSIFQGPAR